jgi:hypothetical protein
MAGVIESFVRDVSDRAQVKEAFGFDPTAIVGIITMIMELIEGCNQDAGKLRGFAEGNRSIGQLVTLRRACVEEARSNGVSNPLRAGRLLSDAILGELTASAGRMSGDVYQQAIDEAAGA